MPDQLQLIVTSVCHENWDAMSPDEQGRFCAQCQKQVIDFSSMNDRQLSEFFKKPSTGSLCGRFLNEQLEHPIGIPQKRIPWVRYFFQITLPAFLLSMKASPVKAQVPVKQERTAVKKAFSTPKQDTLTLPEIVITSQVAAVPKKLNGHPGGCNNTPDLKDVLTGKIGCMVTVYQPPVSIDKVRDLRITGMGQRIFTTRDTGMRKMEGVVYDEKGDYLYGITIRIKGTKTGTLSGANGRFSLQVKPGDVLVASGVGCEHAEKTVAITDTMITIKLRRVVMGYVSVKKVKRKKKDAIQVKELPKPTDQLSAFRVSPNPAQAGQTVQLVCSSCQAGKYQVQLTNMSGQSVHQQVIEIQSAHTKMELVLPGVPPGYYLVNLINEQLQKKYFANLVIQ
ncbi:MAG: carboxypeptidase-like regulatory domain-containing protein [Bacteroidetes bacterium]|nr:carboxypeptidase-like regulatory domain-containing protein [Bacteroidota bacterium]